MLATARGRIGVYWMAGTTALMPTRRGGSVVCDPGACGLSRFVHGNCFVVGCKQAAHPNNLNMTSCHMTEESFALRHDPASRPIEHDASHLRHGRDQETEPSAASGWSVVGGRNSPGGQLDTEVHAQSRSMCVRMCELDDPMLAAGQRNGCALAASGSALMQMGGRASDGVWAVARCLDADHRVLLGLLVLTDVASEGRARWGDEWPGDDAVAVD